MFGSVVLPRIHMLALEGHEAFELNIELHSGSLRWRSLSPPTTSRKIVYVSKPACPS